ncbi:response regulator [Terasakiella sp. SH-1]|uniref:response regulator n=1 Tax=Terasakiella sp. SH-1 TaxID=2560057 RepID=UPI001073DCDB|nr:response regulator [Terasakiella sp. SH-1]
MSEAQNTILVVDDTPEHIQIISENLKPEFKVLAAKDGKQALKLVSSSHPDIVLLDINMPGMDGYEVCKEIKSDLETQDIEVIFISANDSLDEIMAGFDAGASDYLIKPIEPAPLLEKVRIAIKNIERHRSLSDDKNMAFQTAMSAMTNTAELGALLEFEKGCRKVKDLPELADHVVSSMENFSLNCCVQIRVDDLELNESSTGIVSPLQLNLMKRSLEGDRIKSYKDCLVVAYPHVTVVMWGMPVDDEEKTGRYRDHLAALVDSCDQTIRIILEREAVNKRNKELLALVVESEQELLALQKAQEEHKRVNKHISENMLDDLQSCFLAYDLMEEQEQELIRMVNDSVEKSQTHYEEGLHLDSKLKDILNRIMDFAKS